MSNKNFAVGLFVLSALLSFVFATLWLTGKQGTESTVSYSLFFEQEVGGLMLGGPVFYLGVEVGTVTSMDIVPGDPVRVRVDVEVLKSAPVNAGTYGALALQGITGVAVIKLFADPGTHPDLKIGEDSQYPVIKVRDAGFSALLAKAPGIVDKMDTVLLQINEILGEENRKFVNDMLVDVSRVTGALAAQDEAIGEIPVLINQTMNELREGLAQVKTLVADLEPGVSATLENLQQATDNLATMTARMDQWTATNDPEMNAFMAAGLGQVPALLTETRAAIRALEKLLKELREDPSQLIYKPNQDGVEVEQ